MNVIYARFSHQDDRQTAINFLVRQISLGLMQKYAVNRACKLAVILQVNPILKNEDAMALWVRQQIASQGLHDPVETLAALSRQFDRVISEAPPSMLGDFY